MLFNIQLNTNLLSVFCFFLFWFNTIPAQSQTINKFNCYALASDKNLYEYNITINSWLKKGTISGIEQIQLAYDIEAMAFNPIQNILYAIDQNIFGTIDMNTLVFTPINYVSGSLFGFGEYGNQLFDDITAMTYDPYSNIIWAVNNNPGRGPGTEDFLIKINPNTGHFIPNSFEYGYDYAMIPSVYDATLGNEVYDVEAIAINPYSKILYAIQSQQGSGSLTTINKFNGNIESYIYDFQELDIKGLSISTYGTPVGISTSHSLNHSATLTSIDVLNGTLINFAPIDTFNTAQNFENLACNTGIFDLALKINLSNRPNVQLEDKLIFDIEIFNQGNIEVDAYTITVYLPVFSFFNITEDRWIWKDHQTIETEVFQTIHPGEKHVQSLNLHLNTIQTAFNVSAEISDFQNRKINEQVNQFISLPDIDSTPDTINNEISIEDNLISGGGPKLNQDEDDHDIVKINGGRSCENTWNLTSTFLNGTYYAVESIVSSSPVTSFISLLNPNYVQFISGGSINLEPGFSIESDTSFKAEIGMCSK